MHADTPEATAVELLQQLGLREYEARCFVALVRLPAGTARDVSEVADVPRTRVYEAVETIADRGLVEVQRGTPRRFRAMPVDAAVDRLREEYRTRFDALRPALESLEPHESREGRGGGVWTLVGDEAVAERARAMVEDADDRVLAFLGAGATDDALVDAFRDADDRGVAVTVCAADDDTGARLRSALPHAAVGEEPPWLGAADDAPVSRVVVADDATLVGAPDPDEGGAERGVIGEHRGGLTSLVGHLLTVETPRTDAGD